MTNLSIPLTIYKLLILLNDPNSFLAKDINNQQNFMIDCETMMLHKYLKEQYYLLCLEEQRVKAIEDFESYEVYREAKEKQLNINANINNLSDKQLQALINQSIPVEIAQSIMQFMDRLLASIGQLNQLVANKTAMEKNLILSPATVLQNYQAEQAEYIDTLYSSTFVFEGKTYTIDLNDPEMIERRNYAKGRKLLPEIIKQADVQTLYKELLKNEVEFFQDKGYSTVETSHLAAKNAKKKTEQVDSYNTIIAEALPLVLHIKSKNQLSLTVPQALKILEKKIKESKRPDRRLFGEDFEKAVQYFNELEQQEDYQHIINDIDRTRHIIEQVKHEFFNFLQEQQLINLFQGNSNQVLENYYHNYKSLELVYRQDGYLVSCRKPP